MSRHKLWLFAAVILFSALAVAPVYAAPTPILNYQAQLRDTFGTNVANGTYSFRFRIYDADTNGTVLWEESHSARVTNGLVSVRLGTVETLDIDFNSGNYYLGVTIGSDDELSPRVQLGAVPFAANASRLDGKSVGTGANNVLGLNSTGGFKLGSTIETTGDLKGGTSTLDRLTVRDGFTLQSGNLSLPALSIQGAAIANETITGSKILDGSVGVTDLASGAVTSAKINVPALNSTGLISGINSGTFASLDGSALTNVGASSIAANSLDFAQFKNAMTLDASSTIEVSDSTLMFDLIDAGEFVVSLDGSDDYFTVESGGSPLLQVNNGDVNVDLALGDKVSIDQTVSSNSTALDIALLASSTVVGAPGNQSNGLRVYQNDGAGTEPLHKAIDIVNLDPDVNIRAGIQFNDNNGGFDQYIYGANFGISGSGEFRIGPGATTGSATLDRYYEGTATIDFADTATAACSAESTISVTDAATNDAVFVSPVTTAMSAGTFLNARVSSANTVSVSFCNMSGSNVNPGEQSYRARVIR